MMPVILGQRLLAGSVPALLGRRRGPDRREDTRRRPALARPLDLKRARFGSVLRVPPACSSCPAPAVAAWSATSCVLSAAIGRLRYVCYRRGADGPLGRRSGLWYGR